MKKTMSLSGLLLLGLLCSGCQAAAPPSSSVTEQAPSAPPAASAVEEDPLPEETGVAVLDKNGKTIGHLPEGANTTLTDAGIFYSLTETSFGDSAIVAAGAGETQTVSYHLYDPQTQKNYSYGSIPGQGYEAGYARTEYKGILYTLVTTGEALDKDPDPLLLAAFDLSEHTMECYTVSNNGFPYTAMAEAGGKLLILNHDQTDVLNDKVYVFDPDSRKIRQVLEFELKDDTGDSIRSLYSDGEKLYLLRLHFEKGSVKMFLDAYDFSYQKLSEQDISALPEEADAISGLVADDVQNEMKQMVNRFFLPDSKTVYYENFSSTRFIGSLETGKLLSEDSAKGEFTASTGSGTPFFFFLFGGADGKRNELLEWKNGSLASIDFAPDDSRYYVTSASASPGGKRLVRVEYQNPENKSDTLPAKYYLF